jgi:hypothetical protein
MKVSIKNDVLIIEIPLEEKPYKVSPSGKTIGIASSHGNQKTTVIVEGKPLTVGLNAYISAK